MSPKKAKSPVLAPDMASMAVNLDSPSVQQRIKQRRRRLITAWALVIMGALGCLAVFANLVAQYSGSDSEASAAGATPGRGEAWVTVEEWLTLEPSPLPGGQILSWDGVEITEVPTEQGRESYTLEQHTFTLAAGSALFESVVEVYVGPTGATAMSTPSLLPLTGAPSIPIDVATWPGYTSSSDSSGALDSAVQAWADAFASGDPDALKFVVNDSSVDAYYVPLTGVASAEATIVEVGTVDDEDAPSEVIARVELAVTWAGQDSPDEAEDGLADAEPQVITYDVLIEGVGTGSPRVVSWGGPGSGPELTAYSVALSIAADEAPEVTTTPTPSSEEEPSASESESPAPSADDEDPAASEDDEPAPSTEDNG